MEKTEIKHALEKLDMDETMNKLRNLRMVVSAMEGIHLDDDDSELREEYLSSWASIVKEYLEGLEKTAYNQFQVVNFLSKTIDEEM